MQSSDDIKKAVQESGIEGEASGHELVFMMHLLKHLNGPTALFRFLHDSKLESLSFLVASYKDKLRVSYVHVLYVRVHVLLCVSM